MAENKASAEEKEALEKYLLQFLNIEKRFPLLPGINNKEAVASLMGLSEEELTHLRDTFRENARKAALELLKDDEVTDWIDELPFEPDDTIVAFGDSMTDDLQGWFSILEYILNITVPEADFTFINAGVSYNTSTDALQRLNRDVLSHQPDWVIVGLGTFDAQRLHVAPNRNLVPLAEFWENINTIETTVKEITENPVIWITPPPVITEMLQQMRLFHYDVFEEDLRQYREILTGKTGYIVDPLGKRMHGDSNEPEAWYYLSDGLHPSLSGHVNTVKELLRTLVKSQEFKGTKLERPEDMQEGEDE